MAFNLCIKRAALYLALEKILYATSPKQYNNQKNVIQHIESYAKAMEEQGIPFDDLTGEEAIKRYIGLPHPSDGYLTLVPIYLDGRN